jgi:hypothetical protein
MLIACISLCLLHLFTFDPEWIRSPDQVNISSLTDMAATIAAFGDCDAEAIDEPVSMGYQPSTHEKMERIPLGEKANAPGA